MLWRMPDFPFKPNLSSRPHNWATSLTRLSDLWVFNWSQINTHWPEGSVSTVAWMCAAKSSSVPVGPIDGQITLPVAISKLAINPCVPCRLYSNSGVAHFGDDTLFAHN